MKVLCYRHKEWLTNCYLLLDDAHGSALLIDAGAPVGFFEATLLSYGRKLDGLLLTHFHHDHTEHLEQWCAAFKMPIISAKLQGLERSYRFGNFDITILPTPGHCDDHLAFLINKKMLFTGDLLFKGSVGGTAQGSFQELEASLIKILALPDEIEIYPGHAEPTTLKEERRENPFLRFIQDKPASALKKLRIARRAADLLVDATDYDGDRKYLVRFNDTKKLEVRTSL